eukprot:SAG11_NODE_35373_length_266_cov_180.479042_1_plen_61_part_10
MSTSIILMEKRSEHGRNVSAVSSAKRNSLSFFDVTIVEHVDTRCATNTLNTKERQLVTQHH